MHETLTTENKLASASSASMAFKLSDPIESARDLPAWFEAQAKPKDKVRIGAEHEKFLFHRDDLTRVAWEKRDRRAGKNAGIETFLASFAARGWQPVTDQGKLIGLECAMQGTISLEPGGQLELAGLPVDDLFQVCQQFGSHLDQCRETCEDLDMLMLGVGFDPLWAREAVPHMPKSRYGIMRNYMPKVGGHGLDMMMRTATVQVSLDFSSEADMVRKFRASLALQPIVTALFANSPFAEGQDTGFQSYRGRCWFDTDPDRSGLPACVFESGFGFERWTDQILDTPMYFVRRNGAYINASGQSFRDFLDGRLPALPAEKPLISDWEDHMTTLFPEVRLKAFLEMRGADTGSWDQLCALPALWVGCLYGQTALDEVEVLARDFGRRSDEERMTIVRDGLKVRVGGRPVLEWGKDLLAIARRGLEARKRPSPSGHRQNEVSMLDPLEQVVFEGETNADRLRRSLQEDWGGHLPALCRAEAF